MLSQQGGEPQGNINNQQSVNPNFQSPNLIQPVANNQQQQQQQFQPGQLNLPQVQSQPVQSLSGSNVQNPTLPKQSSNLVTFFKKFTHPINSIN